MSLEQLIADIESYIAAEGISQRRFGLEAANDTRLVRDLKAGRMPTLRMVDKIYAYMNGE